MRALLIFAAVAMLAFSGCLGATDDTTPTDGNGDQTDGDGPGAGDPNLPAGPVQESHASWLIGLSGCAAVVFLGALDGVDHAWVAVQSDAQGLPFAANFTSMAPAAGFGVSFAVGDAIVESFTGGEEVTGTVPAEAESVLFWSCLGAEMEVHFVVSA